FLVLARMAASIRKGESLGSWLYGVAYRIATKASREKGRMRELEGRMPSVPHADQSADLALRELQAILDDEISRLPAKYRGPLVPGGRECKSRDEAAQELGWKLGTLSSRLAHARRLLQQRLTRRGVTLSAAFGAMALATDQTLAMTDTHAATTLHAAM